MKALKKQDNRLSTPEKKMLSLAINSSGQRVTLEDLANASGKSVDFVIKKLQEDSFREIFLDAMKGSISVAMPEVVSAFISKACEGSFPHGKLLMEIVGLYSEESSVNVNATIKAQAVPSMTEEEKDQFLRATLEQHDNELRLLKGSGEK